MAKYLIEPGQMGVPGELLSPEKGDRFDIYKDDGVYSFNRKNNGFLDKSHVKISYYAGDIFEGKLKFRKYAGQGKYIWKNGGQYEGNFTRGKLAGQGKYTEANGDVYEGEFKNNKYNGAGKYTWADGSAFEGTFKNGRLISGQFTDVDGNVYSCRCRYRLNGERKNTNMQLIKRAPKKEEEHEKKKSETKAKQPKQNKNGLLSKDTKLITVIRGSARGPQFKNLYSGASGKSEKSEKDLLSILNYFTNSDAEQMQRIFKSSKIYDSSKGQEYLTEMINGTIKKSKNFAIDLSKRAKINQRANNAAAGAAH